MTHCGCYHAPEEHDADGCRVCRAKGRRCPPNDGALEREVVSMREAIARAAEDMDRIARDVERLEQDLARTAAEAARMREALTFVRAHIRWGSDPASLTDEDRALVHARPWLHGAGVLAVLDGLLRAGGAA